MTERREGFPDALSRREFMRMTAAAAAGAVRRPPGRAARPNILWIIGEDLSPDLGCYGNRLVHTPHLDRLAAEGLRFTNAFVTGPICSPSRSAIATGMYQTSLGAQHHRSHRDDGFRLPDGVRVFTDYFRAAGYHTSNVLEPAPGVRGTGKNDFNFAAGRPFDGSDWNERAPGQPFYAQVNFVETHRPFHRFPERPIDPAKVTLPPYYPDHPAVREDWAMYLETVQHLDVKVGKVLRRLEEEGLAENTIVFFFGDHGRPMPRGKEFLYDEGLRIPLIVRIPEKFRPQGVTPGSVREDLVSAIDITATSLKLAGIEPPAFMAGQAFLDPGARTCDAIFAARDRSGEAVDRMRCVRTQRFKYIRNFHSEAAYTQPNTYKDTNYPTLQVMRQLHAEGKLTPEQALFMAPHKPAEELFDLAADPHELRNLAGAPAHEKTLRELRALLDRWIADTGDKGAIPEPAIPREFSSRTQVDGWCNRSIAAKADGVLQVRCSAKSRNRITRSYVTEGGDLRLRLRARTQQVRRGRFLWRTVTGMGEEPRSAPIDFTTDGRWGEYSVPFRVEGYLALIELDFGDAEGLVEIDTIRLCRRATGQEEVLAAWEFV